jgi:hypothetical protein
MKILLIGTFLLMQSAFAQDEHCDRIILAGSGDSRHLTFYTGEVLSNDSEMMDAKMALNTSNLMNQELDCKTQLDETNSEIVCSDVLLKNHHICNVKTVYGFYLVYKDYVDTVHITFNRWD